MLAYVLDERCREELNTFGGVKIMIKHEKNDDNYIELCDGNLTNN